MITISLCMIVKNEEDKLENCLTSAKDIADEIIIVDTGSTDNTKQIAKKFTDKIYDFEWIDDFSAARNYSFSKATKDYILWLDADDIILEDDRKKLLLSKKILDAEIDVVMMKYNVAFDDNGNVTMSFYRERLLKRSMNFKWIDPIHEYIQVYGKIISSDIAITHSKKQIGSSIDRNLNIFKKLIASGKEFSPRNLYYYARELYYKKDFDDAIIYFNKFLKTDEGWREDKISSCFLLSICYENIKDKENIFSPLFKSFEYDLPRAEICCQIANYYFQQEDYHKAIFWYELATNLNKPEDNWGFILHDCWDYIPYIQLCVCYCKIGNVEKANMYNDIALKNRPNDKSCLNNKKFFKSLKNIT